MLSVTGAAEIPKTGGLQLSGSFQYQSGAPFTLTDSTTDDNRNGLFTDNVLPAGTYSGAAGNRMRSPSKTNGGFRGARGPDQMLLSLRGRYSFRLPGNRSLQAWVDVFNLTNRANFNNPSSDRRDTATFLILRARRQPDADGAVELQVHLLGASGVGTLRTGSLHSTFPPNIAVPFGAIVGAVSYRAPVLLRFCLQ